MVEGVERLEPELRVSRTADREPLRHHQIEVRVPWRPCDADRAVAERAERNDLKRVDVQPVTDRLIGGNGVANAVRSFGAALILERSPSTIDHRNRQSGARLENAS